MATPVEHLVQHVVVVGFHATQGAKIEFSYPPLRGSVNMRSPKISDTADIARDTDTMPSPAPFLPPSVAESSANHFDQVESAKQGETAQEKDTEVRMQRGSGTAQALQTARKSPGVKGSFPKSSQDWGILPRAWAYLPILALPDGVHDSENDTVYFTLPPYVHCVACFRQVDAASVKTLSASFQQDSEVAARGSIQKSVVLLCRRPLFGVLGERLILGVRAYFDQKDFARTDLLASLYHGLNTSFTRPSMRTPSTLYHGLDLRALFLRLGADVLSVLKLILLEKRVIIYSQPIFDACKAVLSFVSLLPGALDSLAPGLAPLDDDIVRGTELGFPLQLFGEDALCDFQPYAPLPLLMDLLRGNTQQRRGCLIGSSKNVGTLLSSNVELHKKRSSNMSSARGARASNKDVRGSKPTSSSSEMPEIDALVDLNTGSILYRSDDVKKLALLSREEMVFMKELVILAKHGEVKERTNGAVLYSGSDDHLRHRVQLYLSAFLRSVASVAGQIWPPGTDLLRVNSFVPSPDVITLGNEFDRYNLVFAQTWVRSTLNAREWLRACPLIYGVRAEKLQQEPCTLRSNIPRRFEGPPGVEFLSLQQMSSSGSTVDASTLGNDFRVESALEDMGFRLYKTFSNLDARALVGEEQANTISDVLGNLSSWFWGSDTAVSPKAEASASVAVHDAAAQPNGTSSDGLQTPVQLPSRSLAETGTGKSSMGLVVDTTFTVPRDCDITAMNTPALGQSREVDADDLTKL
ncbi:Late secretory pathway protein AVL9-like [Porphyridium purpureum]|uniref:Late secretory pathway protein AVL9-like n=1 Tax=Porphyridium purpureum TaxID=35688 RepID=A0A5J4Z5R6_PORPP|nr:Late secretory pathway protein AVL9-like [Porphyridium purpureum]|eukprot:POR7655..scf295_1